MRSHEDCRKTGCIGECCRLQPISIDADEFDRLKNGKNNVYQSNGFYFMGWDGNRCNYSNDEIKSCELGDMKPRVCKEWYCDKFTYEKIKEIK